MKPLELCILTHYQSLAGDFNKGDFATPPAVRSALEALKEAEMVAPSPPNAPLGTPIYRLTDRGRVYLSALSKVPLPVQRWVMPDEAPRADHA